MAADKLVDSTNLDACLTASANAIRSKTGSSSQIAFDFENGTGFATDISSIPVGANGIIFESVNASGYPTAVDARSLPAINAYAFYNKDEFNGTYINMESIKLPAGITTIAHYAFNYCKKLASLSLPNTVQTIDMYSFRGCSKLVSLSFPSSLTSIDMFAFQSCTGLTTITFEGTPTSINSDAFKYCSRVETINVPWAEGAVANAPWGATNATINYNYTGE